MNYLNSTHGLYHPPDQPGHGFSNADLAELYRPPIFTSNDPKHGITLQTVPSTNLRSHAAPGLSASPDDRSPLKTTKILIEPHKAEHSAYVWNLIEALHPTLGRIVESWSGETRETQLAVLRRMIKELETDSQSIITCYINGKADLDVNHLRQMLKPLCGPEGKLCSVDRKGSQSGVSSITCAKCQESFNNNPVQAFAHHLISGHWKIKVFACYAANCNKRFAWSQDRDRHEKSKHNAYRRKAYEVAMKQEALASPYPATEAELLYQAFKGYNIRENRWES